MNTKIVNAPVEVIIESHVRDGRPKADPTALLRAFSVEPDVDGLHLSDIFVRELFQNILDLSSDPKSKTYDVVAEVEEVELGAKSLDALNGALGGIQNFEKLVTYRRLLGNNEAASGFEQLQSGGSVRCTIVSDHTNQCEIRRKGMHGTCDPVYFGQDSGGSLTTLERYVLASGYPDKAHDGSVGGHGIGKIANTIASRDNFVVIYTYTNEDDGDDLQNHKSVCVGFDEHVDAASRDSKEAYEHFGATTGAMYVGHHHSKSGKDGVRELRGEPAKALASAFGIVPRESGDFGTSVCVFNSKLELQSIRAAYHKWFFPAHHGVKVEPVIRFAARKEGEGTKKASKAVNFADFPELSAYVRAYEIANERKKPLKDEGEKLAVLRKSDASPLPPGRVGFAVYEDFDEEDEFRNKVAYVRDFIVVNYVTPVNVRGITVKNFAGVYLPPDHKDVLEALAAAEPPKHHVWTLDQSRMTDSRKTIVSAILDRIKAAFRSYVNDLQPDERFKDKKSRELAHALGKIFSNSKGANDDVERLPSELLVRQSIKHAETEGGLNKFLVSVTAQVSKNFDEEQHEFPLSIKLTPHFYPVGAISREPLPVRFEAESSYLSRTSKTVQIDSIEDVVTLDVETQTASRDVQFKIEADIV